MQNLSEIRVRLRSVEQTRQITNAMNLLSTSRMKKAMIQNEYNQEYFRRIRSTMKGIISSSHNNAQHEYLKKSDFSSNIAAFIVIASDKGLCGAYNHNILNLAFEKISLFEKHYIWTAGIMATEFFKHKGLLPDVEMVGMVQGPSLHLARQLAHDMLNLYNQKLIEEIFIVYTHFENSVKQYPRIVRLLPLLLKDFQDVEYEAVEDEHLNFLYEPSVNEVFCNLIPEYITGQIHASLTMAYISEHSARMNAMNDSTKNADEMIAKLQMQYNRIRQHSITEEITEIIAGSQYSNQKRNK